MLFMQSEPSKEFTYARGPPALIGD